MCKLIAATICAFLSAKAAAASHPGPAGLKWDESLANAKLMLSAKLTFAEERDFGAGLESKSLIYSGNFGGFACDAIVADFYKDKLILFVAILQEKDVRPAWRKWQDVVDSMTTAYGKPKKLEHAPPKEQKAAVAADRRESSTLFKMAAKRGLVKDEEGSDSLDEAIRSSKTPPPVAEWRFDNDVVVSAQVVVGDPDAAGSRSLLVTWTFYEDAKVKAWKEHNLQVSKRDF